MKRAFLYTDGGTRKKNPGKASCGFVLYRVDLGHGNTPGKSVIQRGHEFIGIATNNVAEYHGLILGLKRARSNGVTHLVAHVDSQLVYNQVNGYHKCKQPHIQELVDYALDLVARFEMCRLRWVPREKNKIADKECRLAIAERWPT